MVSVHDVPASQILVMVILTFRFMTRQSTSASASSMPFPVVDVRQRTSSHTTAPTARAGTHHSTTGRKILRLRSTPSVSAQHAHPPPRTCRAAHPEPFSIISDTQHTETGLPHHAIRTPASSTTGASQLVSAIAGWDTKNSG